MIRFSVEVVRGIGVLRKHVSILSRHVCGEASGVLRLDPLLLLWRDCGAGFVLAGAVRPHRVRQSLLAGRGGARFLPRSSRYMVLAHAAGHVCGVWLVSYWFV